MSNRSIEEQALPQNVPTLGDEQSARKQEDQQLPVRDYIISTGDGANTAAEGPFSKHVEDHAPSIPSQMPSLTARPMDPAAYAMDENVFQLPLSSKPHIPTTEAQYEEPDADQLLAPPDFRPYFTVIEDLDTGAHHHPTVHYIFSDDDADILTDAILEAIDQPSAPLDQHSVDEERIVVLEIAADGRTVTSTSSLSSQWQGLQTSVVQAPSWGESSALATEKGLMIKVSGQEIVRALSEKDKKSGSWDLDGLVKTFNERLAGLEDVLADREDEAATMGYSTQLR